MKAADVGGRDYVDSQGVAVRLLLFLNSATVYRLLLGGVGRRAMTAVGGENQESVQCSVAYVRALLLETLVVRRWKAVANP